MTRARAKSWDDRDYIMSSLVMGLVDVLSLFGWVQEERKGGVSGLFERFRERMIKIVELALQVRQGIGENITSAHIRAVQFRPNFTFDPNIMDDTYADDRMDGLEKGGSTERVAGTTEVGLERLVKGRQPEMLLKPKVVLCSALREDLR